MGAIDVVRGALMISIVLGHAMINLEPGHPRFIQAMHYALSGTVGFVTLSGLMVGWFASVKRDGYDRIARRYAVQAVRLIMIAHPLIAVALFLPTGHPLGVYLVRSLFITDSLAVLFVLVVPIVPHTTARARLAVGAVLIVSDMLLDVWTPVGPATGLVHELLCGVDPSRSHVLLGNYGLLPIAGMFLVGTWLGGRLAIAQRAGDEAGFARRLAPFAALGTVVSACLVLAWRGAHVLGHPDLARLLYPDYETTLYPMYLGWTLLLYAYAVRLRASHPAVRAVAVLGKTSLFVYVVQYFVVETAPNLLGWNHALPPVILAGYCALSIGVLVVAAAGWDHARSSDATRRAAARPSGAPARR
jgi:hypothetical protein